MISDTPAPINKRTKAVALLDELLGYDATGRQSGIGFTDFKSQVFRLYEHAPHLEALDTLLTSVARYAETKGDEGVQFAVIDMPPRHGKSLTTARLFPPWYLGRNPDHRIMLVSYAAGLAEKHSRWSRNLVGSPAYRDCFSIHVDRRSSAAGAWDVDDHEGGMDAIGVLGAASGKGANVLVIDDLLRGRADAESPTIRDRTWDAFIDDLLTRLEPGGAVVWINTRWHHDDPVGRVLRNFEDITHLHLPAIAEADDPIGRVEGEALWPDRYELHTLLKRQSVMTPYSWSALFQGNPVPAEGGIFKRKWFDDQLVDDLPLIVSVARYWDLAMSDKQSADFTVGTLAGLGDDGNVYIIDVERRQVDWGDLSPYLARVIKGDGPAIVQGIENAGYMSRAIQQLNADPKMGGYSVFGIEKSSGKLEAALPFAARCGAKQVKLLRAGWNDDWLSEILMFTGHGDTHDDQVDSVAGVYNMLTDGQNMELGGMMIEMPVNMLRFE